jgi:hypothetical protein
MEKEGMKIWVDEKRQEGDINIIWDKGLKESEYKLERIV